MNAKEKLRGTTALMWAADQGHAAAIQLLIQRGADLQARSNRRCAQERRPGKSARRGNAAAEWCPGGKRTAAGQAPAAARRPGPTGTSARSRRAAARHVSRASPPPPSGGATAAQPVYERRRVDRTRVRHAGEESVKVLLPASTSTRPPGTAGPRCSWRRRTGSTSSARS